MFNDKLTLGSQPLGNATYVKKSQAQNSNIIPYFEKLLR